MPVKHSKRYRSAVTAADLAKEYPLKEAVEILSKFPKAKFDETVELSFPPRPSLPVPTPPASLT
jgi:large subunit ribosomal protein L1